VLINKSNKALDFCRPLRGLRNHFLPVPGVARCALTPGYFLSRLRREEQLHIQESCLRSRIWAWSRRAAIL